MERVPQDEQRDRSLFMNKHTVMLLIDPATGAIVDANPAACAFYGYSVDELTTRKITDLNVLPRDDIFRQMQHAAAHERQHVHFRHRVATGELRDVEVDSGAITLDGISLLYSIVTDVTERHRAEQMLQEREARFRALTEHASDLVSVLDAQGIYRYVSPSHRTVLGYAPEELLGTLAFDLVAPADRARAQAVFASGVVRPSGGVRLELSLRHADGSWRRVDLIGNNRLADPAVQGIILNSRDITEGTRAVEALQVSERHYRQLFEQANDAILVIDPEGEIVLDANARACALYGITHDAFLGTSLKRISQDVPRGDAHLQRLIAEGSYEEFETVQFRADGTPLSLLINASMITFQGRPAVLSVNRDMTARKHAEDTLRTSEQQFRLLFADSPQPMWVYDTQTLRVLEVNEAAVAHYGYTRAEFLALSITDLRPLEDVPRLLETVRTAQPDLRRVEQWRHRLKDGRLIDVEITAHTMAFAGHAAALVLSYDVSARIQAEAERERFFTLSLDLLCIADMAGYFTSVNPAFEQTLGYTPQEMCAEPFLSFVHPDDQAATLAEVAKLATGATTITFENRYRCKDGTYRWLLWTSVPAEGLLYATARDITERKEMEQRQQQQLARISALHAIDMAIAASLDLRLTLGVVLEQVCTQLHADAAQVLVLDEHTLMLEAAATRGFLTPAAQTLRLRLGQDHAGRAALERCLVTAPDFAREEVTRLPLVVDERFVAYAAAPLIAKGQVRGVLEVFHRAPLEQDAGWTDFLQTLAGQTAIAIDNAHLYQGLQRSNTELRLAYDATIDGWSRALDLRDKETEGHSQRVTALSLKLAQGLGMAGEELVQMRRGALLHDIGKMGVPDAILLKPGPLSEEEWVIMRRHPTAAYDLLAPVPYLLPALDIPYCHHEKWDGTGYPRGLRAEQIPLAARIFAVVDVADALLSDRPYRAAWSAARVQAHIASLAGSHFDPAVVAVFLSLLEEDNA